MSLAPQRPEALAEPVRKVGPGWVALYLLANVGMFIPMRAPTTFLMPEQIAQIDPAGKVGSYAWVSMMGAISGIVLAPLAGALSDRTTSRFGRRRPWLIVGSLVRTAALVCIGIQTTVAGVAIGSLVLFAAFMIIGAGLFHVVPDRVPVGQRGVVLGWAGLGWAGLGHGPAGRRHDRGRATARAGRGLLTEVLPASADRGKDMALANLMTSLPYVLVPPIASVVLGSPGGYPDGGILR